MEREFYLPDRSGCLLLAFAILILAGCGEPPAEQSRRSREAELLAAEAAFAINLRDWPRAEQTLARATELDPARADLWLSLGSTRVRAGRKPEAREAYLKALRAFEQSGDTAAAKSDPGPTLAQIRTLALLGRMPEARSLAAELPRRFPAHPLIRAFSESGGVDQMLQEPAFWELAFGAGAR